MRPLRPVIELIVRKEEDMGDKLAVWLQVIGNFGLIVGLALVGFQIRQSSELARVQMGHDAWLLSWELAEGMMGENPQAVLAKTWFEPEALTDEELVAADSYFWGVALDVKRVEYVNDAGLDLYSEEVHAEGTANSLASPVGRAWWALNKDNVAAEAPRISERIDELLANGSLVSPKYYKQLRAEIAK